MGNKGSRESGRYNIDTLDDKYKIKTIKTVYKEDEDPLLLQLKNCPTYASSITDSPKRYTISTDPILDVLAEYQDMLRLGSKAIELDQAVIMEKINRVEQVSEAMLTQLATNFEYLRQLEPRLSEIDELSNQISKSHVYLSQIITTIDALEFLLQSM